MRLSVETGPLAGTQIPLDREHPTTLGSGAACTVRIQDDGVASEHAVVKALRDNGFGVKALVPGLRVNGREVEVAALRDGDVLELGTTRITYGQPAAGKKLHVSGFKILGELGRGGMGIVYRAEQQSLHRQVALKVLDHRLTRDSQFVERFVAEARAAAKLSHPNVVQVFDVDQDGGTYYYAMELMQGSLEAWLKKHGRMPVERTLAVIADAAAGLAYAESLRIVHRDIKPDNLMLDQHDTVKIADLGLAHTDDSDDEHHAGTPHFMAPEQALRKPVDHRTDLYALGCTFYRLVTGRTPFRGQTIKDILRAHVKEDAEPAHKVEGSVPVEVSAIIQKLMQKEPADRYQSAADLLEAVNLLLAPPAKKGLWIGLAATAAAIAGGAIWWAATREEKVVKIRETYADPEKQKFADELEVLRAKAKQDAATIALLRAQVRGLSGEELAMALDEVAAAHAGTDAGLEAKALASRTRAAVQAQQTAAAQRSAATDAAVQALSRTVDKALSAGDPPAALAAIAKATPPSGVDEQGYATAVQQQRQRVQEFARSELQRLARDVETARTGRDAGAIGKAAERLQRIVQKDGGWPAELIADRAAVERTLADAQHAAQEMQVATSNELWQRYDAQLRAPDGCVLALATLDFARASAAATQLAQSLGDAPAAAHGQRLAAALQQAAVFADALAQTLAGGKVQLAMTGDTAQTVARWQRTDGSLVLLDASRKPAKEVVVPPANVLPEHWAALAAQVQGAPEGSRECFLTFASLAAHALRARAWLSALAPGKDDSGTGDAGYPLSSGVFDAVLRQLPSVDAPWCEGLRYELAAGRLLTSGLRAFSERRNLAAAAQLERLLADHPHSLAVAMMP